VLLDFFERMDDFFKRFKVYSQSVRHPDLVGVLVKAVVKVLKILSIATKEVKKSRTSGFFLSFWGIRLSTDHHTFYSEKLVNRLVGRKDIDDALMELEKVFQGEHYTVTAQVLQDTGELRRGT
jgi:hypothetical protein